MEVVKKKYHTAATVLQRFHEDISLVQSAIGTSEYRPQLRSSAIQSFKFSFDTLCRFLTKYMEINFDTHLQDASPRLVFRNAATVGIIHQEEFEIISKAIADRNITSHTYNQELAEEILQRIPDYYELFHAILSKITLD